MPWGAAAFNSSALDNRLSSSGIPYLSLTSGVTEGITLLLSFARFLRASRSCAYASILPIALGSVCEDAAASTPLGAVAFGSATSRRIRGIGSLATVSIPLVGTFLAGSNNEGSIAVASTLLGPVTLDIVLFSADVTSCPYCASTACCNSCIFIPLLIASEIIRCPSGPLRVSINAAGLGDKLGNNPVTMSPTAYFITPPPAAILVGIPC